MSKTNLTIMRITIAFVITLMTSTRVSAQMDNMFYFPSKTLDTTNSVKYEQVFLKMDTIQLSGIFLKPKTKPKATILFFHGAGGNVTKYLFITQPLVNDGYQVFMIDFRGYGRSTGTPTHMNIAADGQEVFNYLVKRKDVRRTKVILYGASVGTQIAVHLAKQNLKRINGLILDGTVSSFTDLAADHSPVAQREMILKSLPSPYSAKEDIKAVAKLPKLFIHSKEDKDVPFNEGKLVYDNASYPKTLFLYTGNHLEAMKVNSQGLLKAINTLVKK